MFVTLTNDIWEETKFVIISIKLYKKKMWFNLRITGAT